MKYVFYSLIAAILITAGCQSFAPQREDILAKIDVVQDNIQSLEEQLAVLPEPVDDESQKIRDNVTKSLEQWKSLLSDLENISEDIPDDAGVGETIQPFVNTYGNLIPSPFGELLILGVGAWATAERKKRQAVEENANKVVKAIEKSGVIDNADELTKLKIKAEMGPEVRNLVNKAKVS